MGIRGGVGSHIADLVLGLLDSLQLRRVRHHAEAFALILLKLLLVAHLEAKRKERAWGQVEREDGLAWPEAPGQNPQHNAEA